MDYLIWSIEHRGWWKASRFGYTTVTYDAGRFSEREARAICEQANAHAKPGEPEEIMVPAPSRNWCLSEMTMSQTERMR
jgi:hypothetical protein